MPDFDEKTFVPDDTTNWDIISLNCSLSEQFMEKYIGFIYWPYISLHQKMSKKFAIRFCTYIDLTRFRFNKNITKETYNAVAFFFDDNYYYEFIEKIEDRKNDF